MISNSFLCTAMPSIVIFSFCISFIVQIHQISGQKVCPASCDKTNVVIDYNELMCTGKNEYLIPNSICNCFPSCQVKKGKLAVPQLSRNNVIEIWIKGAKCEMTRGTLDVSPKMRKSKFLLRIFTSKTVIVLGQFITIGRIPEPPDN